MTSVPVLGPRFWKRAARVTLNGVPVAVNLKKDGLRIAFSCVRHNRIEPNEAECDIFGLDQASRDALSRAFDHARNLILGFVGAGGSVGDLVVEAGYDGVVSQLCKVDITSIEHEWQEPGWVTHIRGQDGVLPFANSIVNESLAPGVDVNLAKTILAQSMKIAFLDADSETTFQEALSGFAARQVAGGFVLQGRVADVLTDLLESMKLAWSFQDGKLQLLRFDGTTTDVAVLLSPQTGLRKRLEIRELGRARATSLLNTKLTPGRQVKVTDELGLPQGAGIYRVDRVEHTGDTHEGPWDSVVELRPSQVQSLT